MASSKIKTPRVMNWSLQPRPRSPEQFVSMMEVIVEYNGVKWWEKDEAGLPINQLKVLTAIAESPDFSLSPKKEKVMQGRTYVTMNPPTLGFAYISDEDTEENRLIITDAGYQAAKKENLQTLFIRQLLKWQYPSYQHGGSGGKGSAHFPLNEKWSIHPFLVTLEICYELDYLTKYEMSTYVLTMIKDSDVDKTIEEIKEYRKKISSLSNSRKKKEQKFIILKEKMREVYDEEIKLNRYKKRQEDPNIPREEMINKMLEAKIRNNRDYSDTVMRYFRFTGLFEQADRKKKLKLNPHQQWKVEEIIENKANYTGLNNNIDDAESFYEYFGNPTIPKLPWETKEGLHRAIYENLSNMIEYLGGARITHIHIDLKAINGLMEDLKKIINKRGIELSEDIHKISSNDINLLINTSKKTERLLKEVGKMTVTNEFRKEDEFENTLKMFENVIENKKWKDPYMECSLLLEWALFRSIYALDGEVIPGSGPKLNFDGSEPIHTASGRQPDVIGKFENNDYLVLEGTIASGARQYDSETEPVTRHVANFIDEVDDAEDVLCFFVARDLHENTKNYFAIYNLYHKHPTVNGYLNIIPMDIGRFTEIMEEIMGENLSEIITKIIDELENVRTDNICSVCGHPDIEPDDWYEIINDLIDDIIS